MPDTFTAFGVFLLAVIPGGLYIWSFERVVGRWGIGLSDRLLRVVAASAVFLSVFSYPIYYLWTEYFHHRTLVGERTVFVNRLAEGAGLPGWLYALPLAYVFLPFALGTLAGRAVRSRSSRWSLVGRIVAGRDPAPRAWDFLFSSSPAATVRLQLKGTKAWIGGQFGDGSYAAGYPEEPQDLYIEATYMMNQSDGAFATDERGDFVPTGGGLLIRWDEVHFPEVFPLQEDEE